MAEEKTERDNRKHRRVRKIMKVCYKYAHILDYEGDFEALNMERYAQSVDISVSGIQFLADECLPVGQVIKMDINLPEEEVPLTTFGRVEWCKKDDEVIGIYRIGVNFMLIDADHTNLLRKITGE
jgi:hypothetical protein